MKILRLDNELEGVKTTWLTAFSEAIGVIGNVGLLFEGQKSACIKQLFVHPDYRGKGYGRQLVEECIRIATAGRCITLGLMVAKENRSVWPFYKSLGFTFAYEFDGGDALLIKSIAAESESKSALEILWNIGLLPSSHATLELAARGASSIVAHLREDLANPPSDVQELVLQKLGIREEMRQMTNQLDAAKFHLRAIRDWSDESPWDDPGYCARAALALLEKGTPEELAAAQNPNPWRTDPPDESGLWWWWNGNKANSAFPISIKYNPLDKSFCAEAGQHGWNRFQPVKEMGGWWMRCIEPAQSDAATIEAPEKGIK